jgi:suppressor of G2 allele of SKP1
MVTEAQAKAEDSGQPKKDSKGMSGDRGPEWAAWNRAYIWRCQTIAAMQKLPPADHGRRVTVTKVPPVPTAKKETKKVDQTLPAAEKKAEKPIPAKGSVSDEQMKLRIDFYQTAQQVTISLFVKNVVKDQLNVESHEQQVSKAGWCCYLEL